MIKKEYTYTTREVLCQNAGTKESPKWIPVPDWALVKIEKQERGGYAYLTQKGPVFCSYRVLSDKDPFKEAQLLNGFAEKKPRT